MAKIVVRTVLALVTIGKIVLTSASGGRIGDECEFNALFHHSPGIGSGGWPMAI